MDLYIPDGLPEGKAFARTSRLAIGAHADDLEIMAYHGIAACYGSSEQFFSGIVVTDGAGSSRNGSFAQFSNEQMVEVRRQEQRNAATLGHYGFVAQFGSSSDETKKQTKEIRNRIAELIRECRPDVIYLHNPADKHPTHIAVLKHCIAALREVSAQEDWQPRAVYGCEVWRDLDWLSDESKIPLDCSAYPELALALIQVFDSQISGGKRYDLAALGRRHANATFSNPRSGDTTDCVTWAMDLMPLLTDPSLTLESFMKPHLDRFRQDVLTSLSTGEFSISPPVS